MGEIPEDILMTARKIALADGGEPGCHIEYMVAEALLAERKRCADVAMKEARDFVEHRMVEVSYGATCAAKAIMRH